MARTHALSMLAWMNNTVHPTFTHFFMPQKFSADEAAQKALRAFAVPRYRECLQEIETLAAKAQPWMTGEHPGALDAYALTLLRWGGYAGIDPTSFPATWDLAQRFAALPGVARVVERERLELSVYKPA
jgi:glutathione S-transferase